MGLNTADGLHAFRWECSQQQSAPISSTG
jgi:hypothetical protein